MTREEAIAKVSDRFLFNVPSQEWSFHPRDLVDALISLGMLKLDEPKSAETLAREALIERGFSKRDVNVIEEVLTSKSLKIVEK